MTEKYKDFLSWNFYQIYPRSFRDANNDGHGDFKGITEKIPYLADLGINAVWLSPFFESPNDDSGYDISDYYSIQKEFGNFDDFKEMLDKFHSYGIKVIIDFVANHTSTSHKWFKEALKGENNPYHDYYIWADRPLTDWQASFGGSTWEYVDALGKYYFHSFAVTQADLNWENPKVRREIKKITDFWIDLGVDGFRCDVLDYISKDFQNGKMTNGPKLHEYIRELFGREKTRNLYIIGECWGADENNLIELTAAGRRELTASFLGGNITNCSSRFCAYPVNYGKIHDYFTKYQYLTQKNDLIFAPFFENHDRGRCVTRFSGGTNLRYEIATFFATILYTMRGTPFILQGEEFGTTDAYYDDIKYFDDIETLNFYYENKGKIPHDELMRLINFGSRDNGRRPMAWNGGINGGFNDGAKTWLPVHSSYKEINLEKDLNSEKSIFKYFKKIIAYRKNSPVLLYGRFKDLTNGSKNYFMFSREYKGKKLLIVCNYDKESEIKLPNGAVKIMGNHIDNRKTFRPFETAIYNLI